MHDTIRTLFKSLAPAVDFCSLRVVDEVSEQITVRQNILQPLSTVIDRGAMVTVIDRGGYGYAATSDLSATGLKAAIVCARHWAQQSAGRSVVDYSAIAMPRASGRYASPVLQDAPAWSRKETIAELMREVDTEGKLVE